MFAKLFQVVAVSAMVAGVVAGPVPRVQARAEPVANIAARNSYSFDNWHGISSLSGFDNFYGSDNYRGEVEKQTIIEENTEVVCHSETIEIVQQRLLVLQEMAKRIITEQICEVETQTIVFEQFISSMGSFGSDIRHQSSRSAGYDSSISGHYSNIVNSDGSLSSNDLGFNGQSNGQNTVVPTGGNWNAQTSPASVSSAYSATKVARSNSNSTASKSSSAVEAVASSSSVAASSSAVAASSSSVAVQSSSAASHSTSAVSHSTSAVSHSTSAVSHSSSAAPSKSTAR